MRRQTLKRNISVYAAGFLLSLSALTGCGAPEEQKLGFLGEFCSADIQCQEELICDGVRGVCSEPNTPPALACASICSQRAKTCGSIEANCPSGNHYLCCYRTCKSTVENWDEAPIEAFKTCFTEKLTCEEAISDNAPSICVGELPLPADRKAVCDRFESIARDISSDDTAIDDLRLECRVLARTGTQENWDKAKTCDDQSFDAQEFADCVNTVFTDLDPKLRNDAMFMGKVGLNQPQ